MNNLRQEAALLREIVKILEAGGYDSIADMQARATQAEIRQLVEQLGGKID